jgi:NTP pyrophosphatase (non-canonical NTP hydrolase)
MFEKTPHLNNYYTNKVLDDVFDERGRQDKKWGLQDHHSIMTWLAILSEEVGEAAQAALHIHFPGGRLTEDDLRLELIQVAAVAVAMVESLDRNRAK